MVLDLGVFITHPKLETRGRFKNALKETPNSHWSHDLRVFEPELQSNDNKL